MCSPSPLTLLLLLCFSFVYFTSTAATNFTFTSFSPNDPNITVYNATTRGLNSDHPSIILTGDQTLGSVFNASGRACYSHPVELYDPSTNITTDFTTYFEFSILFPNGYNSSISSGGFAFFITSQDKSAAPADSAGGWLGLFTERTDGEPSNQMVAVEFDTYQDQWDPSNNHVGINVNSIISVSNRTWNNTMVSNDVYGARISYNGTTNNLTILLKDPDVPNDFGSLNLSYNVNLRDILPENVIIGFSASTGRAIAIQTIRSWNFTSTLVAGVGTGGKGFKMWIVGLIIGLVVLVLGVVLIVGIVRRNTRRKIAGEEDYQHQEIEDYDSFDEDFERAAGPKRFTYSELAKVTDNFSVDRLLGKGGFGGVYRGYLAEQNMEIAVKKISSNSNQGKKEYVSEVNTIGRLRHRNLVQLLGWSHERGNFLLVYEYMPNGSLDSHLFGKQHPRLLWPARYKIVRGLASALLYLHEEWEQCVVHRDIKSSNVMLDSNFNAKLGDFGLARLIDHNLGSQTTVLAGTMGYMAPECIITSKASKESDVFSFGVVALEIACGRRVVKPNEEQAKVNLVSWVWDLYGRGRLLEAADDALYGEFGRDEMIHLLVVGLWCAHPDHHLRPSIRQAIQVLNFEGILPSLPSQMPVPTYNYAPATAIVNHFTKTSSSDESGQIGTPSETSTQNTLSTTNFNPNSQA
ncbi:hypothetical protein Tsubulata_041766 [Turnera subulata]|uniref:non-specific serine/threonine protein kinase n=1 Tax=Turnera subulata TaxID=218843 RepID=A0A9Q0GAQ3_9ROSI|nr:hypothetical protein Tsubulata_041766 [Turnera subulata]